MDYLQYFENYCGAVYVAVAVFVFNLVAFVRVWKEENALEAAIPLLTPIIEPYRKYALIFLLILPLISIFVTNYLCKRGYTNVAYIPALFLNGAFLSLLYQPNKGN
jgi:hypothetical protein